MGMTRILFVCLGNICRSPMAEGMFRHIAEQRGLIPPVRVASAGTGAWHIGDPPDTRAQDAAAGRGVDLSAQRACQVSTSDFAEFDLILAMDRANLSALEQMAPAGSTAQLKLFLDFAGDTGTTEVPDPYYGGRHGFAQALDLIEAASRGLADYIEGRRG